jgi:hypothetical protein
MRGGDWARKRRAVAHAVQSDGCLPLGVTVLCGGERLQTLAPQLWHRVDQKTGYVEHGRD